LFRARSRWVMRCNNPGAAARANRAIAAGSGLGLARFRIGHDVPERCQRAARPGQCSDLKGL
jgi:hypothetical protein